MSGLTLPAQGLLLGIDHSRAATGVALASLDLGTTRALTVLCAPSESSRLQALKTLVTDWEPVAIVVGLPVTLTGEEQAQTRYVRAFAEALKRTVSCPVLFHDERYSTLAAEADLKKEGFSTKTIREVADAEAAREIIQGFLDVAHRATQARDSA